MINFHFLHDNTEPLSRTFPGSVDGNELLFFICTHLHLNETKFFGLRFLDSSGQIQWVRETKSIQKQFSTKRNMDVFFLVKFYVEHPDRLKEESTRYQFFLQLKRDILRGRMSLDFKTAAKLFAYCLQSEMGDFILGGEEFFNNYSSQFRFVAQQSYQLETKAEEIHRTLLKMSPGQAEWRFLQIAKELDFYGIDIHSLYGDSHVEYQLGLSATGLVLFRNQSLLTKYSWNRIEKIERLKKYVSISVLGRHGKVDIHHFQGSSKASAKFFQRCCEDHLQFFHVKNHNQLTLSSSQAVACINDAYHSTNAQCGFRRNSLKRYSRRKLSTDVSSNQAQLPLDVNKQSTVVTSGSHVSQNSAGSHLRTKSDFHSGSFNRRAQRMNRIRKHYIGRTTVSDTETHVTSHGPSGDPSMNTSKTRSRYNRACVSDDERPRETSAKLQRKFEWPVPEFDEFSKPRTQSLVRKRSSYSVSEKRNQHVQRLSSKTNVDSTGSNFTNDVKTSLSFRMSPRNGSYNVNSASESKERKNLPTYNEYLRSKMSPQRNETTPQLRSVSPSMRFSELPQETLSPILPSDRQQFVRYATLRSFNVSSNAESCKVNDNIKGNQVLYSVDSGIGGSADAVPITISEVGLLNPAYCNTQSGADIYRHLESPQQVSSTPTTPRTRSVRSLVEPWNEPDLFNVRATPLSRVEDDRLEMNEIANGNLFYSVNSSGFERSTFTVNL